MGHNFPKVTQLLSVKYQNLDIGSMAHSLYYETSCLHFCAMSCLNLTMAFVFKRIFIRNILNQISMLFY